MLDSLVAARSRPDPRERIDLIANLTAQLRGGLFHGDRYLALLAPMAHGPFARGGERGARGARTTRATAL